MESSQSVSPSVEGILVRPYQESDLDFLESSLRKSMRSSSLCREMSDPLYHDTVLPELLDHCLSGRVLVSHGSLDPLDVVGWISSGRSVLNFIFVKNSFRHLGIAALLLSSSSLPPKFSFSLRGPLSPQLERRFPRNRYRPAFQTASIRKV